jgi:hypothetical protein
MPLQATSGAASYDAFGGGAPVVPAYIEEVFATWLYTGNGSTQTITNGIDLSTKGGMVWIKSRSAATNNFLFDTARSALNEINSNTTDAQASLANSLTAFNTTGFSLGSATGINVNAATYASWTFRKQPKFFDVVTYTGNGTSQNIAHSLGSVPGCIFVKKTSGVDNWGVYHRSIGNTKHLRLNTTDAEVAATLWNNTDPTATQFSVSGNYANESGFTYVAYLFAHDAGGFGLTGTDNVISCGSFTTNGGGIGQTVNLGYEPQWILWKNTSSAGDWQMYDTFRRLTVTIGQSAALKPNTTAAEAVNSNMCLVGNGFRVEDGASATYIYIAIRRGPMKVPTTGTSVFGLSARSGNNSNDTVTGGQTDDAVLIKNRGSAVASLFSSRLTGTGYLVTSSTQVEVAAGTTILQNNPWDVMNGVKVGTTSTITNASANTYINYLFKRAPSFMDVVCYTGTGVARTVTHNLGVAPELIICKKRSAVRDWGTGWASLGWTARGPALNSTETSFTVSTWWNDTAPTSSVFTVGTSATTNQSAQTFVAYLFATCPGVSKVGSYTGTGATQTIDCGFTSGARFVLIKRTDSTGDWYVWDTARGIVAGNDSYLLLNSTAAEVTNTDYIDTYSAGFEISSTAPAAINASGGSFIFFAVA